MCMNFAGRGEDGKPPLIIPDFWTSFDPSAAFSPWVFKNPKIMKFIINGRRMDLIPGGTEKICDSPNAVCVNYEHRGYRDFIKPGGKVIHALDSFLQALDILYHLGFRRIYCVGCDMIIRPSESQIEAAKEVGVEYENGETIVMKDKDKPRRSDMLRDFLDECIRLQLGKQYTGTEVLSEREQTLAVLESLDREQQYSFTEQKRFQATVNTDGHYWERVQYLRLARRSMSMAGLKLINCTPNSRLQAYFMSYPVSEAADLINAVVGDLSLEMTEGRYRGGYPKANEGFPHMQDVRPYGWKVEEENAGEVRQQVGAANNAPDRQRIMDRYKQIAGR